MTDLTPSVFNRSPLCAYRTADGGNSPILGLDDGVSGSQQHPHNRTTVAHVAVVGNTCCRTLKYFQALATLGQVPIVDWSWLLDVCRAESDSCLHDGNQVTDWPLHILATNPGKYELKRGYVSTSKEPVEW